MKNITDGKRILIFLALTFSFTYALEIFIIGPALYSPALAGYSNLLMAAAMLIPALCVLLTRLITGEGFRDVWIRPNLRGRIRFYIFAWLAPIFLTVFGSAAYFVIFPDKFDPGLGYLADILSASGKEASAVTLKQMLYIQLASAVIAAPVANFAFCFGEEWGWRGYLLPKMLGKFRAVPAMLISGVIWGLWHAPLTVMGHNYGVGYPGYPYTGILAMCAFCIVMGVIFSYVSVKTRSCLPAVIAHGTLNGFAPAGLYFTPGASDIGPFTGPAPTGVIGGLGFIILAAVLAVLMTKDEKNGKFPRLKTGAEQ